MCTVRLARIHISVYTDWRPTGRFPCNSVRKGEEINGDSVLDGSDGGEESAGLRAEMEAAKSDVRDAEMRGMVQRMSGRWRSRGHCWLRLRTLHTGDRTKMKKLPLVAWCVYLVA